MTHQHDPKCKVDFQWIEFELKIIISTLFSTECNSPLDKENDKKGSLKFYEFCIFENVTFVIRVFLKINMPWTTWAALRYCHILMLCFVRESC